MELYALRVLLEVAAEKSFSRAAEKLLRTQPAVSLAVQRLEAELGERLIERRGRELVPTDAGRIVLDYARRLDNLQGGLANALAELRDRAAGRLVIGANESTTLYLLPHLSEFRRAYPRINVRVQRSLSSRIPRQIVDGDLELGVISYEPDDGRLVSTVIYRDHLAFVVSPRHRFARRRSVSIADLGLEIFIAHNVMSPYRNVVLGEFQRHKVPLAMEVEMPTVESIRRLVQQNLGVAFLPRMCVEQEIAQRSLAEVRVRELKVAREIRIVSPRDRTLSHAGTAFLDLLARGGRTRPSGSGGARPAAPAR